jgi:hypothetical protein
VVVLRHCRAIFLAMLFVFALIAAANAPVLGADPSPAATPGASPVLVDPLDPRGGAAAGRMGSPLLAAAGVIVIGLGAASATFVYVRFVRRA